jgi:hypothetical protein
MQNGITLTYYRFFYHIDAICVTLLAKSRDPSTKTSPLIVMCMIVFVYVQICILSEKHFCIIQWKHLYISDKEMYFVVTDVELEAGRMTSLIRQDLYVCCEFHQAVNQCW